MTRLTLKGATVTYNQQFTKPPVFAPGSVNPYAKPIPFNNTAIPLNSGYVWQHGIVGNKTPWPATKDYPAWSSVGNSGDVIPNADLIAKYPEANPYSWYAHSGLVITPKPMTPALRDTINPDPRWAWEKKATHISGAITTFPYCQQYGVFSATMAVPKGKGLWPALWLLRADHAQGPEIDVMEVLCADTKTVYYTVHDKDEKGNHRQVGIGFKPGFDLGGQFGEYSIRWDADFITHYLNWEQTWQTPTPPQLRAPCYLLASLSVGNATSWGGAPPKGTTFYDSFKIKAILAAK